jgi:hypothetical protein
MPLSWLGFNIRTGEVAKGPANRAVTSYPVTDEMGHLKIDRERKIKFIFMKDGNLKSQNK